MMDVGSYDIIELCYCDLCHSVVTMGPQGIVFEVTPEGQEVWRYLCPAVKHAAGDAAAVCFMTQGDTNIGDIGPRSLFM